jgi:hypothetical protein
VSRCNVCGGDVAWSAAFDAERLNSVHVFSYVLVADTDMDLEAQGSIDGTNWYSLGTVDDASASGAITSTTPARYVRFGVTAEHGTGSTVDPSYMGQRG